ncbi:hypothetical protein QQG55_22740 [Brugia pahangi]
MIAKSELARMMSDEKFGNYKVEVSQSVLSTPLPARIISNNVIGGGKLRALFQKSDYLYSGQPLVVHYYLRAFQKHHLKAQRNQRLIRRQLEKTTVLRTWHPAIYLASIACTEDCFHVSSRCGPISGYPPSHCKHSAIFY